MSALKAISSNTVSLKQSKVWPLPYSANHIQFAKFWHVTYLDPSGLTVI